jgi:hypothetical protein
MGYSVGAAADALFFVDVLKFVIFLQALVNPYSLLPS